MPDEGIAKSIWFSPTSRAHLDVLQKRWGVPMAEAVRRAIWLVWRSETCGDSYTLEQPATPPPDAASR